MHVIWAKRAHNKMIVYFSITALMSKIFIALQTEYTKGRIHLVPNYFNYEFYSRCLYSNKSTVNVLYFYQLTDEGTLEKISWMKRYSFSLVACRVALDKHMFLWNGEGTRKQYTTWGLHADSGFFNDEYDE